MGVVVHICIVIKVGLNVWLDGFSQVVLNLIICGFILVQEGG